MSDIDDLFPDAFFCPLTHQLMDDPVVDPEGNTYERQAIISWLNKSLTSPITRNPLTQAELIPNRALKEAIQNMRQEIGAAPKDRVIATIATATPTTGSAPKQTNDSITVNVVGSKHLSSNNEIQVLTTITPPEGTQRTPLDICCVVDVSGSMDTEATMQNSSGQTESHGLSILDIVKHAVLTIIKALLPSDRFSLVVYSNNARVALELLAMDDAGKARAQAVLENQHAGGQTNLWDGLKNGLDVLDQAQQPGRIASVLILTDGLPNVEPPRGHIPMLKRYKEGHPNLSCTINTFGFGYSMESALLRDIAIEGDGIYSFIPDSGFVGTAFVNAASNLLTTLARNVTIAFEVQNGATISKVHGNYLTQETSWGVSVNVGQILYGQSRDIALSLVLPSTPTKLASSDTFLSASVRYTLWNGTEPITTTTDLTNIEENSIDVEKQYLRTKAIEVITSALSKVANSLSSAQKEVNEFLETIRASASFQQGDEFVLALEKDISGQVSEALSRKDYYDKWGKHYLPSLSRAHQLQQSNNFKDPGIQFYGGKLFQEVRDIADDIFCNLPAPTPSKKASSYSSYGYSNSSASSSHSSYTPSISNMSAYYCSSNPCFSGDSLVLMADGSSKPCSQIKKGDLVSTPNKSSTKIVCVVKTNCKDGKAELVRVNDLLVTAYHPIRINKQWCFPSDLAKPISMDCEAVYSFMVKDQNVMIINGVECVTLGHSFQEPVVKHAFFGSELVTKNLQNMKGWGRGLVEFTPGCMLKDTKTQLVCGFNNECEIY